MGGFCILIHSQTSGLLLVVIVCCFPPRMPFVWLVSSSDVFASGFVWSMCLKTQSVVVIGFVLAIGNEIFVVSLYVWMGWSSETFRVTTTRFKYYRRISFHNGDTFSMAKTHQTNTWNTWEMNYRLTAKQWNPLHQQHLKVIKSHLKSFSIGTSTVGWTGHLTWNACRLLLLLFY